MSLGTQNKVVKRLDASVAGEIHDPTWRDIEETIRRLDGVSCTLVTLGIGDPVPHMAIGGGRGQKYVVYATFDNLVFYTLADPTRGPGQDELIAGSQAGSYQRRNCVSLEFVLTAAKTYSQSGALDPNLTWDTK